MVRVVGELTPPDPGRDEWPGTVRFDKTAWKNVLAGLKAREDRIRKDIADAEATRVKAEATLKKYADELATAEAKVRDIIARTYYGDTAVTGTLALVSTSGVGTTDKITMGVGNNGATVMVTVNASGAFVNTTSPWATSKFQVKATTDENFSVAGHTGGGVTDGVVLASFNDAVNANKSLELRGSPIVLSQGCQSLRMRH